mgnify:CR=1 FL=1
MTFINNQALFKITQELLSLSVSFPNVHGKIESFHISKNSHQKYHVPNSYQSMSILSTSPVATAFDQSTCLHATPQHYQSLMETFSTAFPDFDFSTVAPWNFKLVNSPEQAQNNINWTFRTALSDCDQLMSHLWSVLEKEINPSCCYIYTYESDRPDAFSEMGTVFNMNYFFLNEKMSKIVLVHLREGAHEFGSGSDDDADSLNEEIEDQFGYL